MSALVDTVCPLKDTQVVPSIVLNGLNGKQLMNLEKPKFVKHTPWNI